MKLFQTNGIEIVRACQENFCFELPVKKRTKNAYQFFNDLQTTQTCDAKFWTDFSILTTQAAAWAQCLPIESTKRC